MNTVTRRPAKAGSAATTRRTVSAPCTSTLSSASFPVAQCERTDSLRIPFQSPYTLAYSRNSPAAIRVSNSAREKKW